MLWWPYVKEDIVFCLKRFSVLGDVHSGLYYSMSSWNILLQFTKSGNRIKLKHSYKSIGNQIQEVLQTNKVWSWRWYQRVKLGSKNFTNLRAKISKQSQVSRVIRLAVKNLWAKYPSQLEQIMTLFQSLTVSQLEMFNIRKLLLTILIISQRTYNILVFQGIYL